MTNATCFVRALPLIALAVTVSTPVHAQVENAQNGALVQYTNYPVIASETPLYVHGTNGNNVTNATFSWTSTCTTCAGFHVTGSGSTHITNGSLGASSSISVTGTTPGSNFALIAGTLANYYDFLDITGGSGNGVLVLSFSLDGSMTQTGPGSNVGLIQAGLELAPTNTVAYANGSLLAPGKTLAVFSGLGAHSDTVVEDIPFTYGTTFEILAWLGTGATYSAGNGNAPPFSSTVNFYNTLALNSALVYNGGTPASPGTQLNSGALIGSASGLGYTPDGNTPAPVPLPASAWLLAGGVAGLLGYGRRKGNTAASQSQG